MLDNLKQSHCLPTVFLAGALAVLGVEMEPTLICAQTGGAKESEKKEILIKTPWGGLEAAATPDPSRLGLPVYPGARLMKDEGSDSLSLDLSVKGKPDVHFLVGKFETPDGIEKVRDFYRKRLGKEVTKFIEKTDEGGMAFEMKGKSESKFVQLKSANGGTLIDLVRLEGVEVQDGGKENRWRESTASSTSDTDGKQLD
jgi:hypothetical protein